MSSTRAAGAITALLIALIAHNVVLSVRNQLIFDRWHRVKLEDRALVDIAGDSTNKYTSNGFGMYYRLRAEIPGAAVETPPPFTKIGWWLRKVARIRPATARYPRLLSAERFAALAEGAELETFRVRDVDYPVYLRFGEPDERHVLARQEGGGPWLLLPAAAMGAEPQPDK